MFRHTKLSVELKANGCAYAFVMVNFAPAQVRPWWRIQEAWDFRMMHPFFLEHGQNVFDYYSDPKNAEMSRNFNMLMQQLSISQDAKGSTVNSLVAGLPIFNQISSETISPTVVDVGGGVGHLLSSLLRVHPQCRGVLFDLPEVLNLGGGFKHFFFHLYLGKIPILTSIFFRWVVKNHQPGMKWRSFQNFRRRCRWCQEVSLKKSQCREMCFSWNGSFMIGMIWNVVKFWERSVKQWKCLQSWAKKHFWL